jgi:pilus assembly protein Flp/PilA
MEDTKMKARLCAFLRTEEGLTTVEYAIAGGLVGAAVIAAFLLLGQEVGRVINLVAAALQAINP